MDLRSIKKEAWSLADVEKNLQQFKAAWIKPVKSNSNQHLPFLQNISPEFKKQLNIKITEIQKTLQKSKKGQQVNEKLRSYSRYLIELKLTAIQGNTTKYKSITNCLLHDEFWNLKKTIQDVKSFAKNIRRLSHQYNEVNNLLQKELELEHSVILMDQPHKNYLKNLTKTSEKQKLLVKNVGAQFIDIVKQNGS